MENNSLSIWGAVRALFPWFFKNPRYFLHLPNFFLSFKRASLRRRELFREGVVVPPMLILSLTQECNLACKGCYASGVGTVVRGKPAFHPLMEGKGWERIIEQGRDLGVFFFLLAGGEPFLHPGIMGLIEKFPRNFFLVFSNGVAITEDQLLRLKKLKNLAVILSLEGGKEETDARRGMGVFQKVRVTQSLLKSQGTLQGVSVTITRRNFRFWMEEDNLDLFLQMGVRLLFFMEYIPTDREEGEVLLPEEGREFRKKVLEYRRGRKVFIIHSPGDEELVGGCISAGRGFAHVTPGGFLTPCPVSSFSQHNLLHTPLREALCGDFFREIREREGLLETRGSPCALFAHKEELRELAFRLGARERS